MPTDSKPVARRDQTSLSARELDAAKEFSTEMMAVLAKHRTYRIRPKGQTTVEDPYVASQD